MGVDCCTYVWIIYKIKVLLQFSKKKKIMLLQMLGTFSFKAIQNNCDYVTEALAGFC